MPVSNVPRNGTPSPAPLPSTGEPALVAVVDEGYSFAHPALQDVFWTHPAEKGADGIDNDGNGLVDDVHGAAFNHPSGGMVDGPPEFYGLPDSGDHASPVAHGTAVASVLAESRQTAVPRVVALATGGGALLAGFGRAVDYAIQLRNSGQNIRVMSVSMATPGLGEDSFISRKFDESVKKLNDAGILLVCAINNEGREFVPNEQLPAGVDQPNVISVGFLDASGTRLSAFSDHGPGVDIAVLGENVRVADASSSGWTAATGSSLATPKVAMAAAEWFDAHPSATPAEARTALMASADRLPGLQGKVESGRLNVAALLNR